MEENSKKLKNAKLFGGIGAILILMTGMIPYVSPVGFVGLVLAILRSLLGLVGIILEILGVKKISEVIRKKEVFKDYIKAIIIGFIGGFIGLLCGLLFFFLTFEFFDYPGIRIVPIALGILIAILIFWITSIFGSYFIKRSFGKIGEKTQVDLFSLAGNLFFWGTILMIVLVGMIMISVAQIITIVAFFSLPEKLPKKETV